MMGSHHAVDGPAVWSGGLTGSDRQTHPKRARDTRRRGDGLTFRHPSRHEERAPDSVTAIVRLTTTARWARCEHYQGHAATGRWTCETCRWANAALAAITSPLSTVYKDHVRAVSVDRLLSVSPMTGERESGGCSYHVRRSLSVTRTVCDTRSSGCCDQVAWLLTWVRRVLPTGRSGRATIPIDCTLRDGGSLHQIGWFVHADQTARAGRSDEWCTRVDRSLSPPRSVPRIGSRACPTPAADVAQTDDAPHKMDAVRVGCGGTQPS